jgi:hypothetical protein
LQPQPTHQFAESLSGLIERATFFNEENGFALLKAKAKGHRDQVAVIGSLPSVSAVSGYSQASAAELIPGLSTRTLQAWECDRQAPPLGAQALVLDALGGAPYDAAKKRKVSRARKARQKKSAKIKL